MLIRGAAAWTVIFLIAVVTVALPYIERWSTPGFGRPPIWQIVAPTLIGGLSVIAIWVLVIGFWWPRRAWLVYTIAGFGGFLSMLPVLAFVAMPDIVWQLVCAVGATIALVVAVWAGRSRAAP